MNITYQCEQCRAWYTVTSAKVGSKATCNHCAHMMTVPNTPDLFENLGGDFLVSGSTSARPVVSTPINSTSTNSSEAPWGKFWRGALGVLAFIFILSLKFGFLFPRGGNRPPRPVAPPGARGRMIPQFQPPVTKVDLNEPIVIPKEFPKLGPPREIVPGVIHYEILLQAANNEVPSLPGHVSKLWLYLPAGARRDPRSLGCVLIVPSESNFISGMKLSPMDRVEHIPYVKAGFAVLSFEIDEAAIPRRRIFPSAEFLRSRAGLVNGRIAIEFLKERVPQIDPNRLYVAGHYAAGTFALLLAEHESSIKACITYAPVVDLIDRLYKNGFEQMLARDGYADLFRHFSPKTEESNLNCPLFLFNARDNARVDASQTIDFADRLKAMGKDVTVEIVNQGGDLHSMHATGIPDGIKWLLKIDNDLKSKK